MAMAVFLFEVGVVGWWHYLHLYHYQSRRIKDERKGERAFAFEKGSLSWTESFFFLFLVFLCIVWHAYTAV
jgi:hypothetical protein